MSTVSSGSSAYCTAAQFLQYHDARVVGDLVSDDGTRILPADLLTNAVLLRLLKRGAGEIEMACTVGQRYTPADLGLIRDGLITVLATSTAAYSTSLLLFVSTDQITFVSGASIIISGFSAGGIPDGTYVCDATPTDHRFSLVGVTGVATVASGTWQYVALAPAVGGDALAGLNADLTMWHLLKRRKPELRLEDCPGAKLAYDMLQSLRLGSACFGILEVQEAGGQMEIVESSFNDADDLKRITRVSDRFFGHRAREFSG